MKWSDSKNPVEKQQGDHNHCRNPGKEQRQDWCYYKDDQGSKKMGLCYVVTCGKTYTAQAFKIGRGFSFRGNT